MAKWPQDLPLRQTRLGGIMGGLVACPNCGNFYEYGESCANCRRASAGELPPAASFQELQEKHQQSSRMRLAARRNAVLLAGGAACFTFIGIRIVGNEIQQQADKQKRASLTKELQPTIDTFSRKLTDVSLEIPDSTESLMPPPIGSVNMFFIPKEDRKRTDLNTSEYRHELEYRNFKEHVGKVSHITMRLSSPYVFVYLIGSSSNFKEYRVLENGEGVVLEHADLARLTFDKIKTLILLEDKELDNQAYKEVGNNGQPTGDRQVYGRYSYSVWAFDAKTGSLGAYARFDDPPLEKEYHGYRPRTLDYSDLRKWANAVMDLSSILARPGASPGAQGQAPLSH